MSSVVPDGWSEDYISEYFDFSIGGTPSRNNELYWDANQTTSNIWVSIRDLKDKFISNSAERISELGVSKSNVKLLPKGTVLMSFKLSIGRLSISMTPLYTNEAIVGFIEKRPNTVDRDYLYYGLQSWNLLGEVDQAVKGATLNKDKMSRILGIFPPLPEQKKIASILTSVDEVIENTQKQIDKLQDLKKATMNELLTKGIGHTEFKDSELGRIPKSWEVTTLGKLARFDSGYAFKNRELAEEGIKIVRISNLHKPNFPYWHFASEYKSTWVVEKGDVLFSWAGVANSINIHRYQGERALINQHIYNFKFESEALKEWTFQVMKYLLPKLKESIEGGAGQLHLTKPFIQAIGIVLPTQSERLRILELSGSLDKQINTVERKLAQTQSLKKSLMQDLLTGKVRVTVN